MTFNHPSQIPGRQLRQPAFWLAYVLVLGGLAPLAAGQERLIDQEPFDLLTVSDGKDSKTLEVYPVKLPNRRVPKDAKPTDKIRVRLLDDDESREFEVQWRDVKKLELHEDRVLAQAQAFTTSQKLNDAYDSFAYLLKNYPNTVGLQEAIQAYWYVSAGAAFREKRYDEALAVLEELLTKNPSYKHSDSSPPLLQVLGDIIDKLVRGYVDRQDYRSARLLLARIATAYPEAKQQPIYKKLAGELQDAAKAKQEEARQHLAANRFTAAYDATSAMLDIWPDISGARELAEEMARRYPLVVVAVEQLASSPAALQLDHWANQRVGRLTDRRLIELRGIGPEGGEYACSLGTWERSDDNRSLTISLAKEQTAPRSNLVASLLLQAARPDDTLFSPAWADVLGGVRLVKAHQVEASLRRSFVVPQALLAMPLKTEAFSLPHAHYKEVARDKTQVRYVLPADASAGSGKPREILERRLPSAEAAILALQRGEVDALDRIQPADVTTVRKLSGVQVGRYAVPTVHVLVPNPTKPWSNSRTFRRALMYGINRQVILEQGILKGRPFPGAQVISGPFPAPLTSNDPLSYAYDSSITPHAYEPLLAATLTSVAKREVDALARSKNEELPTFEGITLGHLPLELHRLACRAMAKQLAPLEITCKIIELNGAADDFERCDFIYTELLISEPAVDAERLFGLLGRYPAGNPHVRLGVQMVQQAATWHEAGQRLRQLHRTLHEDLTVLPLWQVPEHFAVRGNVQGIQAAPVSFYQDIDHWRVTARLAQE